MRSFIVLAILSGLIGLAAEARTVSGVVAVSTGPMQAFTETVGRNLIAGDDVFLNDEVETGKATRAQVCQLNAAPRQAQCRRWRHHPGDSGTGLAPPTNRDCSSCLHHAVRPSACSFHQKSPVTVTGGVLCFVFRVLCFLSCAPVTVQLSHTLGAAKPENVLRSGDPAGTKQWPQ